MGRTIIKEQKRAIPPGFLQELNGDLMEDLWFALAAAKHPEAFAEAGSHPTLEEVFEHHLADVSWEDFWKAFPYEFREQGTCLDEIDALGLLLSTTISRSRFERHFEQLASSSSSNSSRPGRRPVPWRGIRLGSNSVNRTNSSRALAQSFSNAPVPPYSTAAPALQPVGTFFDRLLAPPTQTNEAPARPPPWLRRRLVSRPPVPLAPRPLSQQQNVAYVSPVSAHRGMSTIWPAARRTPTSELTQALRSGQQPQQQQQRTGPGPFSWWSVLDSAFMQAPAWSMGGVAQGSRPWELGMLPPAAPSAGGTGDDVRTRAGGMQPPAEGTARFAAAVAASAARIGSAGSELARQLGSARAALQHRHAAGVVPEARATAQPGGGELSRRSAAAAGAGVARGAAEAGQEASPGHQQRNGSTWEGAMQPPALPQPMTFLPWTTFPGLEGLPSPDALLASLPSARQAVDEVPGLSSPVSGSPYDDEEIGSDEGGYYEEGDAPVQQLPDLYDMYESEMTWAAAPPAPDVDPFAAAAAATAAVMAAAPAAVAVPAAAAAVPPAVAAASGRQTSAAVPRRRLTGLRRSWLEACDPEGFEQQQQQQGLQQAEQNTAQGAAAQPQQATAEAVQAGGRTRTNYRPVWRAVHNWLTAEDEDMLVLVSQIVPYSLGGGKSLRCQEDTLQQLRALAGSRPVPNKVITSIADRLYEPCLSGEAHLVRLTASSGFSRQAAAAAAVLDCSERHGVRSFYISLAGLCSEDEVEAAVMRGLFCGRAELKTSPPALAPALAPASAELQPAPAADAPGASAAEAPSEAATATAAAPGSVLTTADMDAMLSIMQAHAAGGDTAQAPAAGARLGVVAPADGSTAAAAAAQQAGPVGTRSINPPGPPASAQLLSRSRSLSRGLGPTDSRASQGEGFDQLPAHLTLLARCHKQPMLLLLDEVDAAMTPDEGRPLRELLMELLCHLPQAVVLITSSSSLDAWRDAAVLRQVGEPLVQQLYDGRLMLVEHCLPRSPLHPHCHHLFQYL